jgi:catalase
VVHARGAGAHGYFQLYEPLPELTRARFLNDPSIQTPVFVRFSTVAGSRGSADTVRDVRGFATKFYTTEGNFDLVGNNMPVFFIQDGIKFPDIIHAVKPEPANEVPQAQSAHDSFWDFVSLVPESAHMVMWVMRDRAIPRSYRMMEGFGVHTFRLIDAGGGSRLVKFHGGRCSAHTPWCGTRRRRSRARTGLPPPRSVERDRDRGVRGVRARRADHGRGRGAQVRLRPARRDEADP